MVKKFMSLATPVSKFLSTPAVAHIILIVLLLLPVGLAVWRLPEKTRQQSLEDYEQLMPDANKVSPEFINADGTQEEKERLKEQLKEIRLRGKHHAKVALFFGSNYYMAITVSLFAGAVAAIALLLITKSGWDKTNPYVITTFLVMSATAACFGAFPGIFQQEANMANNKTLFLSYVALEHETISYATTGQDVDGQKKTAAEFIHHLDKELRRLNSVAVTLDHSKMPAFQFEKANQ